MFLVFLSHFLIKYTQHLFNIITVYSSYYKYSHLKVNFLDVLELSVISHDHRISHICQLCTAGTFGRKSGKICICSHIG